MSINLKRLGCLKQVGFEDLSEATQVRFYNTFLPRSQMPIQIAVSHLISLSMACLGAMGLLPEDYSPTIALLDDAVMQGLNVFAESFNAKDGDISSILKQLFDVVETARLFLMKLGNFKLDARLFCS